MERKQSEINENNVREFCNVIDCNQGEDGSEVGAGWGEREGEPARRLPMFVRVLISTGERLRLNCSESGVEVTSDLKI